MTSVEEGARERPLGSAYGALIFFLNDQLGVTLTQQIMSLKRTLVTH